MRGLDRCYSNIIVSLPGRLAVLLTTLVCLAAALTGVTRLRHQFDPVSTLYVPQNETL